ncbi:hypothetical protein FB004_111161 [Sinorhizobium medicae]|nr:hypothetical protein FB004_111161 [Sinorhizobium medicae]
MRVLTRGGYDWTDRFPSIADDARRLAVMTAILDGEAVVLNDHGRSDFGMLQRALGRLPSAVEAGAIVFYAFDVLYLVAATCAVYRCASVGGYWSRSLLGGKGPSAFLRRFRLMVTSSFAWRANTALRASSPSTSRSPIAQVEASGGRRSPASAGIAS